VVDPSAFAGDRRAYALPPKPFADGGYAEIFEATVKATGERVAFKRLRDNSAESKGRLRREIQIQCLLDECPHVMPVLDADPDGTWYVMPLAEGDAVDLQDELEDETALVELARHAIAGLRAGHELEYVHRDITPHNLLAFGHPGSRTWVVADWGLVRQPRGKTTRKFTKKGVPIGTDGFISPEVLRDAHEEASEAGDVFALGRVIAWAVTGKWPLAGEELTPQGPFRNLVRHATTQDPRARPTLDELSSLLGEISLTPLLDPIDQAKELADRFHNGEEQCGDQLLELALEHLEEHAIFFDSLPLARGAALRRLVQKHPRDAERLAKTMRQYLLEQRLWGKRNFDQLNKPLIWLQRVAELAIESRDFGLAEDAAEALFEADASLERFDQRRRTRSFLEQVQSKKGAEAVARALKRTPQAVAWYLNEEWRPAEGTDGRIRAALSPTPKPEERPHRRIWTIGRVRSISPTPGSDCEAAYAIHFKEDDQPEPQMVVEYAAGGGGRLANARHARAASAPYLSQENPPKRLVVDRAGEVHVRL
jgi:serine/threonine protein kinase